MFTDSSLKKIYTYFIYVIPKFLYKGTEYSHNIQRK